MPVRMPAENTPQTSWSSHTLFFGKSHDAALVLSDRSAPARHGPDVARPTAAPASAAGAPVAILKQGHPPSSLYGKLQHLSKPLKPSEVSLPTHWKGQNKKD